MPPAILIPIVWLAETLGISVETLVATSVVTTELGAGLATGAQGPLAGPIAGAGAAVRNVEQYSLRVMKDGFYPVMKRGLKNPVGITWCEKGDVWKFGKTRNPGTRYSTPYLRGIGEHGVEYVKEFESPSGTEAMSVELKKILNYLDQYGNLPPGNKVKR